MVADGGASGHGKGSLEAGRRSRVTWQRNRVSVDGWVDGVHWQVSIDARVFSDVWVSVDEVNWQRSSGSVDD